MILKHWYRLLRFGFRLLYNEMAWTYDLVSWGVSLGHWQRWQKSSIDLVSNFNRNGKVLELAHGTANTQVDLAEAGVASIGLDYSKYMGRIGRQKLIARGLSANLVRGNGRNLPFPDGTFSAVISTFPTEFIFHDQTIREANRVLSPGGQFIIILSGSLAPVNIVAKFIEWLYEVTGQKMAVTDQYAIPFRNAGFDAAVQLISLGSDTVVAVHGKKLTHNK